MNGQIGKKLLHTGVRVGEIGRYVLIPGCVERAPLIAAYFDNPRLLVKNREFLTYVGTLDGVAVAVTSTGIGGPSMALTVEELHQCGADTFIRVGSCASTSPLSQIGDVIIPSGAVRMEGVGEHFLPLEFPAVPNYQVFSSLVAAAKECGYPYNTGITITKDSFFTEVSPQTKPVAQELLYKWKAYEKSGATSTCMECAPLFLIGAAMKLRTASIMINATNYNDYSNDDKNYPREWENRAIEVSIAGLRKLIQQDREV